MNFVTIVGRIYIDDGYNGGCLFVAWKYRSSLKKAIKMLVKGLKKDYVEKIATEELSQEYSEPVIDKAKSNNKSAEYYGKNPLKVKMGKLLLGVKTERVSREVRT